MRTRRARGLALEIIALVILGTAARARAQKLDAVPLEKIPPSGIFWSLQRTNFPPWPLLPPFLIELDTPVYVLDSFRGT